MKYNPAAQTDRVELATALRNLMNVSKFQKINTDAPWKVTEEIYAFDFPLMERTRIVVYTTIVGNQVRGDGQDAIRVAGVYTRKDGETRGIVSETRVNRTGDITGIVERTRQRMRAVYAELRDRKGKVCNKCGAPLFLSKNKNEVCAEACWVNK